MKTLATSMTALAACTAAWAEPIISDRNVPVEPGARREVVAEGLEHPWSIAFPDQKTILVTERPGRLRVIREGKLDPNPVAGTPDVFAQGQGGLLDISLHPDFTKTRWIYMTYSVGTVEANRTKLARAEWTGTALTGLTPLFEVSQAKRGGQHFGSRIAWLSDGTLILSIGDGGNPPSAIEGTLTRDLAQDRMSHLGKLIRLRDDGSIPQDNAGKADQVGKPELYSLGHRNIQGLAYDNARGLLWASEHGALGGDELNRIKPGGNYGWPLVSYAREYRTGEPIGQGTSRAGLTGPVLVWDVSIAPSGLMLYDGEAFPQWKGDLFVGALISQDIRRLDLDDKGNVKGETALRIGQRVRDVRQGPDGFVYVLTDEKAGRLLKLFPDANAPVGPTQAR
ncbi:MAG TPA: hypothetical protein DCL54_09600 [Alphaproteobacteria bacterium]|nr:hypothetical protein [Alphaproteobacteria bacterium]